MRKRARVVHTRITEEQYQKLVEEAERQGVTVGHLIRRKITAKKGSSEQNKRPYAPKHSRRISKQMREYIIKRHLPLYQEALQQYVQQIPQTAEPPKTQQELMSRMTGDTMETYMEYLKTEMWVRQQIQKALQQKQAEREKLRRKKEREWQQNEKRMEQKTEQIKSLVNVLIGYLQTGEGEKV